MGSAEDFTAIAEKFQELLYYLGNEFHWDAFYVIRNFLIPLALAALLLQGSLAGLGVVWKWIYPPSAKELHRSALAALQHRGKIKKRDEIQNKQEAEKLLLKAIQRDDLYYPAYVSLAALYIYRLNDPDKALKVLEQARDRGPLAPVDALKLDAEALKEGGNEQMVKAGGSIFHQQDYLDFLPPEK